MDNHLKKQFTDTIEEIINDCEHVYRLTIDYELLNQKIEQLISHTKSEGIDTKIIWDILHARIPSYVNYINQTKHKNTGKKAA